MSATQAPVIALRGVVKRYGAISAVDGASFELRPGGMNYVLGPSGSGKTTLARLLAGLETLDDGEIYLTFRRSRGRLPVARYRMASCPAVIALLDSRHLLLPI